MSIDKYDRSDIQVLVLKELSGILNELFSSRQIDPDTSPRDLIETLKDLIESRLDSAQQNASTQHMEQDRRNAANSAMKSEF